MPGYIGSGAIFILIIGIAVFFLMREVMTWYYKINEIVRNQEKQEKLLEEIRDAIKKNHL